VTPDPPRRGSRSPGRISTAGRGGAGWGPAPPGRTAAGGAGSRTPEEYPASWTGRGPSPPAGRRDAPAPGRGRPGPRSTASRAPGCGSRILSGENYGLEGHLRPGWGTASSFTPGPNFRAAGSSRRARVRVTGFTARARAPEVALTRQLPGAGGTVNPASAAGRGPPKARAPSSAGRTRNALRSTWGSRSPKGRRTFSPASTLGLYASVAPARYSGERGIPLLSPDAVGAGGRRPRGPLAEQPVHGDQWRSQADHLPAPPTLGHRLGGHGLRGPPVDLGPGESALVTVVVVVPPGAATGGAADRGIPPGPGTPADRSVGRRRQLHHPSPGSPPSPSPPRLPLGILEGETPGRSLQVRDGSAAFTLPGPGGSCWRRRTFTPAPRCFGEDRYWLARGPGDDGAYPVLAQAPERSCSTPPPPCRASRSPARCFGSSSGAKEARRSAPPRAPVLAGPAPGGAGRRSVPGAGELEGESWRRKARDARAAGRPAPPSRASSGSAGTRCRTSTPPGPRDRHYVMDHLTGELRFGDGRDRARSRPSASSKRAAGAVPDRRGGLRQPRPKGRWTQLKTHGWPYVDKVHQPRGRAGGRRGGGGRWTRCTTGCRGRSGHRDRARDGGGLRGPGGAGPPPEVARSRCVPLRDLAADPLGALARPGTVSVIAVPRTGDAPGRSRRWSCWGGCRATWRSGGRPAGAGLSVVGPLYIRVDVRARESASPRWDGPRAAVAAAVQERPGRVPPPAHRRRGTRGAGTSGGPPHRSDFLGADRGRARGGPRAPFLQIDETEELEGVRPHRALPGPLRPGNQVDLVAGGSPRGSACR